MSSKWFVKYSTAPAPPPEIGSGHKFGDVGESDYLSTVSDALGGW